MRWKVLDATSSFLSEWNAEVLCVAPAFVTQEDETLAVVIILILESWMLI